MGNAVMLLCVIITGDTKVVCYRRSRTTEQLNSHNELCVLLKPVYTTIPCALLQLLYQQIASCYYNSPVLVESNASYIFSF